MYQQAVIRLDQAADQAAEYRADLAAFADTLDGRRWGAEVVGSIKDMDGELVVIEGEYRDLAAQVKQQGDQGAVAHEQAPWVPDDLLTQESYPSPGAGEPAMIKQPSFKRQLVVPGEARQVDCPRCEARLVPTDDVQADVATGTARVVLACTNPQCGRQGIWSWSLPEADYQAIFGHTLAEWQPEDEDEDDDEPEVFTHCGECDEPLEEATTDEDKAIHPDCDPDKPPKYWMGPLAPDGTKVDPDHAEGFRRLRYLAEDVFDLVLEWETPPGELFIGLPDGSVVDAREWIERPENLELAGGRDQYAGRGEFDPSAPERCWIGQTLPSGRLARPSAKSFDDLAELATRVCRDVFERDRITPDRPYTVMLPGGNLVDAHDWAQHPDTRRLAGCTTVRNRVRFRATGTCPTCRAPRSAISTQLLQGKIGEHRRVAAAIRCDTCDELLLPAYVQVTLVDDASATTDAPPRLIGDAP